MPDSPASRASKVIAESDLKAERLIAMLRMGLAAVLFVGLSVLLSRIQAVGLESREFELFALLIGAACYFTLGAVNLYFATETRLRPWMSWAFNVGEVLLVSVQLYIDVVDPMTPSLLTFASPVMLVAVLVICVQVLRYQIRLHIFTVLLLLVLCSVIMFHDPQVGAPLSQEAANELRLLYSVPPNVMRLVILFALAFLIGSAVYRSRKLIETVARETEIAENQKRFLPDEIAGAMSDDNLNALRLGKEQDVAVMFADIRGFTRISEEIGARQSAELLSRYRSIVTDTATQRGGVVDKFIGDGALVIFGLHGDFRTACKDCLAAARALLEATEQWNGERAGQGLEGVRLALGMHAGPAMIGAIGDDRRLEFTAIGDTINVAARLEALAKERDWTLVVSREMACTAGEDADKWLTIGPISIRGRASPVDVLAQPSAQSDSAL